MSVRDHDDGGGWPTAPDPEEPGPGKAVISFVRGRMVERFCRNNIELDFTIVEPIRWANKTVRMYFPIPFNEPPSLDCKYYKAWVLANNGVIPKRGDRMTSRVFQGYWLAELVQTKQKSKTDGGGVRELEPSEVGRTIVGNLLARAAGAPRASASRRATPEDEQNRDEVKDEKR